MRRHSIIRGTDNVFKDQVSKLIGEKIQLFDSLEMVCENTFAVPEKVTDEAA